ncbi:hypothetical protein PISS_a2393 [Pseudoalteromonas issachenkonii]|uniref:Uncharacterized protein n=1 Tax=Pseudoalteromonas issachenkonii TaxID=152297 RepID=A0ABM6N524_9GAMM|nr:hypothetical protein PSM_A2133 [Pseudoalteromonas sp. SM9913]ATC91215.1 hypothetical protein PISS_a2393 [Pseudoalteromonas issachenkonii]ATD03752.1 hypothetical protein PTET_a2418 [Pseudoalteromonas tetraodonis]
MEVSNLKIILILKYVLQQHNPFVALKYTKHFYLTVFHCET